MEKIIITLFLIFPVFCAIYSCEYFNPSEDDSEPPDWNFDSPEPYCPSDGAIILHTPCAATVTTSYAVTKR